MDQSFDPAGPTKRKQSRSDSNDSVSFPQQPLQPTTASTTLSTQNPIVSLPTTTTTNIIPITPPDDITTTTTTTTTDPIVPQTSSTNTKPLSFNIQYSKTFSQDIFDKNDVATPYNVSFLQDVGTSSEKAKQALLPRFNLLFSQMISTSHTTKLTKVAVSNIKEVLSSLQPEQGANIYNLDDVYSEFCQDYRQSDPIKKWYHDFDFIRLKLFNQHFNHIPPYLHLFPPIMSNGPAISRGGVLKKPALNNFDHLTNKFFQNNFSKHKPQFPLQPLPYECFLFSTQQQLLYLAILYAYHLVDLQLPFHEQLEFKLFESNSEEHKAAEFAFTLMCGLPIDEKAWFSEATQHFNELVKENSSSSIVTKDVKSEREKSQDSKADNGSQSGVKVQTFKQFIHNLFGPSGLSKSFISNLVTQTIMAHKPRGNIGIYDQNSNSYMFINPRVKIISISNHKSLLNNKPLSFLFLDLKDLDSRYGKIEDHLYSNIKINSRYILRCSEVQSQFQTLPFTEKMPSKCDEGKPAIILENQYHLPTLLPIMPSWQQQIMAHIKSSLYYYSSQRQLYHKECASFITEEPTEISSFNTNKITSTMTNVQQNHEQFLIDINKLQYNDFEHFFITTPNLHKLMLRAIPTIKFSTSLQQKISSECPIPFNLQPIDPQDINDECSPDLKRFIETYISPTISETNSTTNSTTPPTKTSTTQTPPTKTSTIPTQRASTAITSHTILKQDQLIKDFKLSSQIISGFIPTPRSTNAILSLYNRFLNLESIPTSIDRNVPSLAKHLAVVRLNRQQFPFTQSIIELITSPLLAPVLLPGRVKNFLPSVTNLADQIQQQFSTNYFISLYCFSS